MACEGAVSYNYDVHSTRHQGLRAAKLRKTFKASPWRHPGNVLVCSRAPILLS